MSLKVMFYFYHWEECQHSSYMYSTELSAQMRNYISVLGHLATILDAHLQPLRHGVGLFLHQADGQVQDPHPLDGDDKDWERSDAMLVFECLFHNRLQVFMGFRSGKFLGQSNTEMTFSLQNLITLLFVWQGAPSWRKWVACEASSKRTACPPAWSSISHCSWSLWRAKSTGSHCNHCH